MIDREKVINELVKHIENALAVDSDYVDCVRTDLLQTVVGMLKEHEPVRPKVLIDTWICGNCKTRLERQSMIGPNVLMDENFNYCPCCGKKVKWDEQ